MNAARALLLVRLAELAYRAEDQARAGIVKLGLVDFHFFSGASTQAFSAERADGVYLAFRATEGNRPDDWVRNAQFNPRPGELGGGVHAGFQLALDEVWNEIAALIGSTEGTVFLAGHSLGASLATLAAARLAEGGREVSGVYTFGQPRTGLGDFASAYNSQLGEKTYRFINHIDLVTRVPSLVQRYRHVGRRMYFNASGSFTADASGWKIAWDDLKYRLAHFGRIKAKGYETHEMSAYHDLIRTLQD